MGRYLTKRMFLLLTPILFLHLLISASSGAPVNSNENGVCISKEGRSLNLCSVFHGKTCCSASQMQTVSLDLENLATKGEAAKDCLDLFELLECSICHTNVGIQSRPLHICSSFCDKVFEVCSDAYFSSDANSQVIVPCGASESIICGKASKWETNDRAFCDAMGFTVQTSDDSAEKPCYRSKSVLKPVVEPLIKTETISRFQDLQKLVRKMKLVQQIAWLVTLLVLGTMLFNRWRYQHQMRAMIQRDARRLIMNMNGIAQIEGLALSEFLIIESNF